MSEAFKMLERNWFIR